MSRLGLTICTLVMVMLWGSHPASAYVWRCQTPQGEMWTSEPNPSDDCQEYDAQYNPTAAPPVTSTSPSPVSGSVVVPVPSRYQDLSTVRHTCTHRTMLRVTGTTMDHQR